MEKQNQKEYEHGIALMRCLAMMMITTLHCVNQFSGLLGSQTFPAGRYAATVLEILCFCGVNCFALISGYLMIRSVPKLSKMVQLWLQCLFFSLAGAAVFLLLKPQAFPWSSGTVCSLFFPVTFGAWWYVTAYFGLFCLMPFVNKAMCCASFRENTFCVVILSAACILLPSGSCRFNLFNLSDGYSTIWLLVLYILGGVLSTLQRTLYKVSDTAPGVSLLARCRRGNSRRLCSIAAGV